MRRTILIMAVVVVAFSAEAQYQEGKHYEVVNEKGTDKPTVTEFFSLYCGHCFQFEGMLNDYLKGLKEGTTFEKSHVEYIPRDNEPVSMGTIKAFLVMKKLGREKALMPAFFDHVHKFGLPVNTEADIKKIFTSNGVPSAVFDKYYNASEIAEAAKKMAERRGARQISNVPTMVVNDKYKINMGSVTSLQELINLTNFLLEKGGA